MILNVVDANGAPQQVAVSAPGLATDASGIISANLPAGPGPYTYQQLFAKIVTSTTSPPFFGAFSPGVLVQNVRSGWLVRNRGTNPMYLSEDNSVPSSANPTSIIVYPGEIFPPPGIAYPITQGAVLIAGAAGDAYSLKVW